MTEAVPSLREALALGIAPLLAPIYDDIIDELCAEQATVQGEGWSVLARITIRFAKSQAAQMQQLNADAALFNARFATVSDEAEKRGAILDFAAKIGADARQLRRDRKAFDAWFDSDAVIERYRRRVGERERAYGFAIERAGMLAGRAMQEGEVTGSGALLARELAPLLAAARSHRGDPRIREAAYLSFLHVANSSGEEATTLWTDTALRDTRRAALDLGESVWTQCHAFSALLAASPRGLAPVLEQRIASARGGESAARQSSQLFLRRHLARMIAGAVGRHAFLQSSLQLLSTDPDGAVRQAVAQAIPILPPELVNPYTTRFRLDRDPQVRAQIFADPAAIAAAGGIEPYRGHLLRVLAREEDGFVLRVAIDASRLLCEWAIENSDEQAEATARALQQALVDLRQRIADPKIRRWASEAYEHIWLLGDAEGQAIAAKVRAAAGRLREGESCRVGALGDAVAGDPEKVGRVLAVLAQRDFGFDLVEARRPLLRRGDRIVRRLWRVLFELRVNATDKRQAHLHTTGREFIGTIAAPSPRIAELAPTKVPGEPLFQSEDGNWRNWLPLVDHVLGAVDLGKPVRLFTSEGVTTIHPPAGMLRRARLYWRVSANFARFAEARNTTGHDFVKLLRAEGIDLTFTPHQAVHLEEEEPAPLPADESVTRFFSVGAPFALLPIFWDNAVSYFATVFANTLVQLAVFVLLAWLWFFGRHIVIGRHARRVRDAIPLRLGGWGTRGKSGTERLKAGLINALGPPLVSKTTGCEAMFLNGEAFGDLTEMFLFRPYDKATIWEQYNLIAIARRLKARVFLWECMGLNPSYVRVLQQDWMNDNIGTLTNTYPDHEDVQGPAGRNIPEVMTEFIPAQSVCLTTEEEMLPILQEGADRVHTRMRAITWKEAGLVHQQLLDRFPYEEHPYNIALVAAMGDELGLEDDFSFKEMADRVVADLGVLKTYPQARIDDRLLEYVMGNSANERFGAMGNWTRMGFDEHDLSRDPEVFVSTVVNNRADRVPRSRVFARILVTDIAADKHFLIGSNIEGLIGFIEEEWDIYAAAQSLVAEGEEPLAVFDRLAKMQRIPASEAELFGRLEAMVSGVGADLSGEELVLAASGGALAALLESKAVPHGDAILEHYEQIAEYHKAYAKLRGAISSSGDPASHDADMRALLRRVFMAKLVPVRDFYIKGEMIVRLIAAQTPPGLLNRIMGMQNIKGTGLDFVYRWQAWEAVARACEQALDPDPAVADKGLAMLSSFQEYGALSDERVRHTVAKLVAADNLPPSYSPQQVAAIPARLDEQLSVYAEADEADGSGGGGKQDGAASRLRAYLLAMLEGFIDGGDAISRRRKADKIYEAMIAEQISSPRAALELKKLTSRQKGGWLANSIGDRLGRLPLLSLLRR
ncbi:hypothetical protein [Qipengyuania marisflavi]|uniref:Poly-gamma-glutamate synthase PgsB n=1 Tax=Qipengyuania marisflavi TaxID=2486356 RepID=A0A5S3P571_9SPHN|nr:hypothetical protein [Qipengyuania marisflavi]TMM48190.1 hypothetical protein FEV51_07810 [Qipengyuania marisflavi]